MRVDSDELNFDDLQAASDLVTRIWEAGTLYCLRDQPRRYTEIGNWLATWSGQRPSDSAITRAVKRLVRAGFVAYENSSDQRCGTYTITTDGKARINKIVSLTGSLDDAS